MRSIQTRHVSVWAAWLVLTTLSCAAVADEPALARLSFWVPPERMAEFDVAYREKVEPILQSHGLVTSPEPERATVDRVFSQLFQFETLAEISREQEALDGDSTWQAVLQDLGAIFGTSGTDSRIRHRFRLYTTPAGPGKTVRSGPGRKVSVNRKMGHWRTYDVTDGPAGSMVRSIFQDRDKQLWFGTANNGVSRYDGQEWTTFTSNDGLAHDRVSATLQDREGYLWFATAGGISRYDGQTWTTYTTEDGLAEIEVMSILQDSDGTLWLGTAGGGISRYDERSFTTFTTDDGLGHNEVLGIFQDRAGNLWFGSHGGVSRYDGRNWTTFTTEEGLGYNGVLPILQDREGDLWFGTQGGGVSRYNGQTWTTYTTEDGLADNWVLSMLQDREGNLWFGTARGGVSRYNGQTWTTFTQEDGLAANSVGSIFQDREGDLWFGSVSVAGGVSRYDGQTWTTFTTDDGLGHNEVWGIFQDRTGDLWFATHGGISRYDGEEWTSFTIAHGLAGQDVHPIIQDRAGNLWFGTDGGASRYDGEVFQVLSRRDGLAENRVLSIFQDGDGYLWFGTPKGVTRYLQPSPSPPSVYINAVVADRRYEDVSDLAISSGAGLTAVEFGGKSYRTRPEAMVYRYRLRGHEKDWNTTHDRRVEYDGLPTGTYTFEVEAVDRDLVYSEAATLALTVHLPYERIAWISVTSIAVMLILWQAGRLVQRDRRLQDANRALEQASEYKSQFLARMSHDLRTPMNAIVGYTRILQRRLKGSVEDRQYQNLENINTSAAHLLSLINDILDLSKIEAGGIDIHPGDVDLGQLVGDCMTSVRPLVKAGVQFDDHLAWSANVHTDPDRLQRVMMNLLSNAVKFTEEGSITVSLTSSDEWLEVSVADTGQGIRAEELPFIFDEFRQVQGEQTEGTGLGLSIAKKSMELLGGSISAASEVGQGTTITLRIKDYVEKVSGGN